MHSPCQNRLSLGRLPVPIGGNFAIADHPDWQALLLLGKQDRVLWVLHDRKNVLGHFLK